MFSKIILIGVLVLASTGAAMVPKPTTACEKFVDQMQVMCRYFEDGGYTKMLCIDKQGQDFILFRPTTS